MKRYRVPIEYSDWDNNEDSEGLYVFVIEANSPEEAIEKAYDYVDDVWDKEGEHKWDNDTDVFDVEEIDKSEWDIDENEVHSVSHHRS